MTSAFAATKARYAGVLLLVSLLVACADDTSTPPRGDACKQVNAKRRSCGLAELECKNKFDACFAECLVGFGCAEQEQPYIDPGLTACAWACSPRFTCNDGSEIYDVFRCDGEGDCKDSEDEQDCPTPGKGGETGENPLLPVMPRDASTDGAVDTVIANDDAPSPGHVTDAGSSDTGRSDAAASNDVEGPLDGATADYQQTNSSFAPDAAPDVAATLRGNTVMRASSGALE